MIYLRLLSSENKGSPITEVNLGRKAIKVQIYRALYGCPLRVKTKLRQ